VGVALVVAAATASAGLALTRSHGSARPDCTWGASSITASYQDGQWQVSQPTVSGCTSTP